MAGEERAQEVWLRNRSRFAALNGLDAEREDKNAGIVVHVNTALPPEAYEVIDEATESAGELQAGEAG